MKESLEKIDKKLLWRETFNSEDDVRRNGGIPTNVTFSGGVGSFSTTSYVTYPILGTRTVSLVIKVKIASIVNNKYLLNSTASEYVILTGGAISVTSGTKYVNGVVSNTINTSTTHIVISGFTLTKAFTIGKLTESFNDKIELFEIYEGTLTASEVSNIYQNRRYKPFTTKLPKILDVDAFDGVAKNRLSGGYVNGISVPSIVNTAVTVVKDNGLNVMRFNGASKLDCGNYNGLTGDITISCWVKTYSYGGIGVGKILFNGDVIINTQNISSGIYVFSRTGIATVLSGASSVKHSKLTNLIITSTSTGVTNIYINGVLSGSANQTAGTPVAGTTNLIIGNINGGTQGLDGKIAQLQIYSGILSANEISQLYTSTKNKYNL